MKKIIVIIIYSFLLTYIVGSYAYKKGFGDSAATGTYVTLSESLVTLLVLRSETPEKSLNFYESMLASNIAIHRNSLNLQSIFHRKLENGQPQVNLEYYKKAQEYISTHPSEKFSEVVIKDINWLVENEDKIF
ncbi:MULTISPECIES: hypothetical protein [unclassified Colwellia]|uniref:hypothetical protein n=1 Tax=unclassified Colwellia TaxID=196834 RepID=UPI0015F39C04|nr:MULTISPECIES: hypothetical protein [unclassified Colwellia]MBA6231440.1 hypothetical protein [Colwellia sp. MB02u-7]MBA6235012.1 hypothetical protein [Colwellia sp. MB02u-11]MBA6254573.1 hypothetical protein [Colwellia sp. MB3u-28]MBA6259217.1 hypothetical protein [Colwellia sp. MB3u-41]MBA6298000.1 hypothetical protein [Colwellia sp. MB3u-22]